MKTLPKSVKWLLDFANIGSKPGKLCPWKLSGSITAKRPPSEPATPKEILLDSHILAYGVDKFNEAAFKNAPLKHALAKLLMSSPKTKEDFIKNRFIFYLDENNNLWWKRSKGEWIFVCNEDDKPSPKEFRDFLSQNGTSENRNMKFFGIEGIRYRAQYSLFSKIKSDIDPYAYKALAESFVYKYYNRKQIHLPVPDIGVKGDDSLINGLKYSHDNTLIQVTCAYILDFWHNQRALHQHLRQCKCCGKFWIEKTRKKYCCKKCEDRFNQASRQAGRESARKQREILSKKTEKFAHNEIVSFLCNEGGYAKEDAEMIFKKEKRKNNANVKSLDNFKRTYGKKEGLI